MVIREIHDSIATEHPGYQKIVSHIAQNYEWPGLKKMVWCYIQNCHSCSCAKASKDLYNYLLKLWSIPFCLWTDVTLDFIISLSISNSYNAILIIVDYLTEKKDYISFITEKNGTITEATTQLLLQNIWKLHGLLLSLIRDKGPQFILEV